MNTKKRVLSAIVITLFAAAAYAGGIDDKAKAVGVAKLGKPLGAAKASTGSGSVRLYAKGGIYQSKTTGTHAVYGPTYDKYQSLGAEKGKLGYPVTDVLMTPDGGTQTLFRRGYILVGKDGAVTAQATPNATFTSDSVTFSGGASATMMNDNTALVDGLVPQSGVGGQTVNCSCEKTQSMEIGTCAISPAGISKIRCQQGTCRKSCVITIVKGGTS